jgi:hypothetical protein
MPTYRLTVTGAAADVEVTQILEVFTHKSILTVTGKTPAELQEMSDRSHRGAVIINLPPGAFCNIEVIRS